MSAMATAKKLHQVTIPAAKERLDDLYRKRNALVALAHSQGWTYQAIADELEVAHPTVQQMVQSANGTLPPSRRK